MIEQYNKYLVDSNIIIYHLNAEAVATNFLLKNFQNCSISRLSVVEIFSFDFSTDQKKSVIQLLKQFKIIDTSESIAMQAVHNREIKRMKLADNLIAATAQVHELVLVTRNTKDFKKLNLALLDPFKKKL